MRIKRMLRMTAVALAVLLLATAPVACAGLGGVGGAGGTGGVGTASDSGGAAAAGADAGGAAAAGADATSSTAAVTEGAPAPDFSYTTVDGASGSLSELKGRVVLLNLWASWCGPCVAEMPDIAALKADYPELEVLAVNVSDDPSSARDFISGAGYDFRWILDEQGAISARYPTDGIPYTIIIDRDGMVGSVFLGSPPDAYATYRDALQQAGL